MTLVLTAFGRAVALDVKSDAIDVREQPSSLAGAGSDYNSLRALTTHVFRFDVSDAKGHVSRQSVVSGDRLQPRRPTEGRDPD